MMKTRSGKEPLLAILLNEDETVSQVFVIGEWRCAAGLQHGQHLTRDAGAICSVLYDELELFCCLLRFWD